MAAKAVTELYARLEGKAAQRGKDARDRPTGDANGLALSIGDAQVEVITYDQRFADAARANGLSVVQPGARRSAHLR